MKLKRLTALAILSVSVVFALASHGLAQNDDAVVLVAEFIRDEDKDIRALAFEQVRTEVPGDEATKHFAGMLAELPAETQVGLLSALKDRGDKAAAPAIRDLVAKSDSEEVRIAAIKALGGLGQADDHAVLIAALGDGSAEVRAAARRGLVILPGDDSSLAIANRIGQSPAELQVALIEILTTRRARGAIPSILAAAKSDNASVRQAAMTALGTLAEPEHVAEMLEAVLKAEAGPERAAAERAVADVCHRIEDPAKQAEPVLDALQGLGNSQQAALLNTLGRVGGPAARKEVEKALADQQLHDVALLALYNWPDGSVAFKLLELARTDENENNRQRALLGLIRVAPLPDDRSDQLRLDLLKTAFAMCKSDTDKRRVIDRAKAVRTVESLRFVKPFMNQDGFDEQACLTIVELAHHSGLRESHKEEFHQALDDVIAISKDTVVVDRANRYKTGQTWVRPKK